NHFQVPGRKARTCGRMTLFRSFDREAAFGVEEVQVAGIHSELDPVASARAGRRVRADIEAVA
ncbi:MAG TPA: hypothetical protein VKX16_13500, partial [Chloroflexota bacterium]|nr:hypothetical protein [Chloroflexota bacterium]